MSTIPLTLIEGSMALPRLRPLGHLPAPFGRDWALLPPAYSLRAELKALYAAMLRTFCMSDQAIRSFCKWAPLDRQRAAVQPAAPHAAQATIFDAPFERAVQPSADAWTDAPTDGSRFEVAPRTAPVHWSALAGGACALGGAAILGWIALGHLSQRHTAGEAKLSGAVSATDDTKAIGLRSHDVIAAREAANDAVTAHARTAAQASALVRAPAHIDAALETASPSALAPASASVSNAISAARRSIRDVSEQPASHGRDKPQQKPGRLHEKNFRHEARIIATNPSSRLSITTHHVSSSTIPANASRASARPSSAGLYSPLAPSRLGVDEYASVTLSAGTHLRDIAPSRSVSANKTSGTGATEWMNHMSQRRVTEVPDQFAK